MKCGIIMNFGDKINQLRNEKKLSLEKLAEHLDIAKSILWKYEKNQTVPSAETLKKIAAFFGVSADYLLFDISEKENITKITDKKLLKQFEEIDKMSEDERMHVKYFLDLAISNNKIKQMAV